MRSPTPIKSIATSAKTLAAAAEVVASDLSHPRNPVGAQTEREASIKRQVAEIATQLSKLVSTAGDLHRQAQEAEAAHNERQADELIAGKPLTPMNRETAELIQRARQTAGSTPAAKEKLEREKAALFAQLGEVQAEKRAAILAAVREQQGAAQTQIAGAITSLAPALAKLVALAEVQRLYCGGNQPIKLKPGETVPWSGEVVVKHFIDKLPVQFRSSAIDYLNLSERSAAVVAKLTAQIEGDK